jgi:hypothetical protein
MFGSTHQFRSLNVSSKRANMVLSPEDRGHDDSDVTTATWIDRYEARPLGVLDDVSLFQLFRRYKWKNNQFELCPRTVRIVNVWPAYVPDKSNSVMYGDYCRAKLQLHHPYRNVNDLQKDEDGNDIGWIAAYERCKNECDFHDEDPLMKEEDMESDEPEMDLHHGNRIHLYISHRPQPTQPRPYKDLPVVIMVAMPGSKAQHSGIKMEPQLFLSSPSPHDGNPNLVGNASVLNFLCVSLML